MGRLLLLPGALFAAALALGQVRIDSPSLHQFDSGPPLTVEHRFLTGEHVFFRFAVTGLKKIEKNDDEFVEANWRAEIRDPAGTLLVEPREGKIAQQVFAEDKDWKPVVRQDFLIPPLAPSGVYKISIRVSDEFGKAEASAEIPFSVRGHEVEPSDALVVRNFRFLRSEEDRNPLREPVYARGSTLWARFDITGYQLSSGNKYDVEYSLAILNAEGKELFAQEQPAVEQGQSFYPRRYTPGTVSLSIDKDTLPGNYQLLLRVRDRSNNQTAELRTAFRVE
jgi:hypothetical protein